MEELQREQFTFYASYLEALQSVNLTEAEELTWYRAIINYALYHIEPNLSGILQMAFTLIRPGLDNGWKHSIGGQKSKKISSYKNEEQVVEKQKNNYLKSKKISSYKNEEQVVEKQKNNYLKSKKISSQKVKFEPYTDTDTDTVTDTDTETDTETKNQNQNTYPASVDTDTGRTLGKDIEKDFSGDEKVEKKEPRHKHGNYGWVRLTDKERQKLMQDFGEKTFDDYVRRVDEAAQATGNKNKWKDWNLTLRKAIRENWYAPRTPTTIGGYTGEVERVVTYG